MKALLALLNKELASILGYLRLLLNMIRHWVS
jgi:hypothetical protein